MSNYALNEGSRRYDSSLGPERQLQLLTLKGTDAEQLEEIFGESVNGILVGSIPKKVPFNTITEAFAGSNQRVATIINQRVISLDSWHFQVFNKQEVDDLRAKEIITYDFNPHMPDRRAPLTVSPIVSHSSESRSTTFHNFGLSAMMEVDNLKTPQGKQIFARSILQIEFGIALHMRFAVHRCIQTSRNEILLKQRVRGASYEGVYKRAKEASDQFGILNKYDKGIIDLFSYLNQLFERLNESYPMVILPSDVRKMLITEFSTEYYRSGNKAVQVAEKLTNAFTTLYGKDVYIEDVTDFDGGNINGEYTPMKVPYMVGEFYTSDSKDCFNTNTPYCTEMRNIAFLNFDKPDVDWDVITLEEMIENCIAFDQNDMDLRLDLNSYRGLIQHYRSISDKAHMIYTQSKKSEDAYIDPFLYFPKNETTPKLVEFFGEQDPYYCNESLYSKISKLALNSISAHFHNPDKIFKDINNLLDLCKEGYEYSLFEPNQEQQQFHAFAYHTYQHAREKQTNGAPPGDFIPTMNRFGVYDLPQVGPNGEMNDYNDDDLKWDVSNNIMSYGNNGTVQRVNTSKIPPGYSTIAHMYYLQYLYRNDALDDNNRGWDDLSEKCKEIDECLKSYEKLADILIDIFDKDTNRDIKNLFLKEELLPEHIAKFFERKDKRYYLIFENLIQNPHFFALYIQDSISKINARNLSNKYGDLKVLSNTTKNEGIAGGANTVEGKSRPDPLEDFDPSNSGFLIEVPIIKKEEERRNEFLKGLDNISPIFSKELFQNRAENFIELYKKVAKSNNEFLSFNALVNEINVILLSEPEKALIALDNIYHNIHKNLFMETVDNDYIRRMKNQKRKQVRGRENIASETTNNVHYINTGLSIDFSTLKHVANNKLQDFFTLSHISPQDPRAPSGVLVSRDKGGNDPDMEHVKQLKKFGRARFGNVKSVNARSPIVKDRRVYGNKLKDYISYVNDEEGSESALLINPYIASFHKDSKHLIQRVRNLHKNNKSVNHFEKVLKLLFYGTYVCGKNLINMAEKNIPVPMTFYVACPFVELTMWAMYCLNYNIGMIEYGFQDAILNFDGKIKSVSADVSYFLTAYLFSDKTNHVQPNVAHCEYIRGHGKSFMTKFKRTNVRHGGKDVDCDLSTYSTFRKRKGDLIVFFGGGAQGNEDLGDYSVFDIAGPFNENGIMNAEYSEGTKEAMKRNSYPSAFLFNVKSSIFNLNTRNLQTQESFYKLQKATNINTMVYQGRQNTWDTNTNDYTRVKSMGIGAFKGWKPNTLNLLNGLTSKTLEHIKDYKTSQPSH